MPGTDFSHIYQHQGGQFHTLASHRPLPPACTCNPICFWWCVIQQASFHSTPSLSFPSLLSRTFSLSLFTDEPSISPSLCVCPSLCLAEVSVRSQHFSAPLSSWEANLKVASHSHAWLLVHGSPSPCPSLPQVLLLSQWDYSLPHVSTLHVILVA